MSEWKPIETAPKDLSEVLVYDPDYGGVRLAQYEVHSKWDEAINDVQAELQPLEKRVRQLKRARKLLRQQRADGAAWPGSGGLIGQEVD